MSTAASTCVAVGFFSRRSERFWRFSTYISERGVIRKTTCGSPSRIRKCCRRCHRRHWRFCLRLAAWPAATKAMHKRSRSIHLMRYVIVGEKRKCLTSAEASLQCLRQDTSGQLIKREPYCFNGSRIAFSSSRMLALSIISSLKLPETPRRHPSLHSPRLLTIKEGFSIRQFVRDPRIAGKLWGLRSNTTL